MALEREVAAEREHRDLAERGDRLHRRLQARLQVHETNPRREHALRTVREPFELAPLLAEALDDPHAGDVFLDDVGDVTRLLLRVPARREHRRAQSDRGEQQRGTDEQHHAREQRRQDEHRDDRHDEHQDVGHADRHELQEALDQRDVGRRAAHELTRLQLVVLREVELLQLAEHGGAQVVLHVERDAPAAIAPVVGEDEHHRRRGRSSA